MLVIRLARTGKRKQAHFRVVVAEKEKAVTGKFVEILGNYNPHEKKIEINKDRLAEYLKNGAQPSNTLAKVLKKEGVALPKWVKIAERNRAPKNQEEEKKEAPKEAAAEEKTEEAPVEEAKEEKKEANGNPSTDAQGADESAGEAEEPAEESKEKTKEA